MEKDFTRFRQYLIKKKEEELLREIAEELMEKKDDG